MSVTPIDIHKSSGGNVVREHIERITSEHARMAELLRHVYAAHYGLSVGAIRSAREYGLEPTDRTDWRDALRRMIGTEIDDLLTEVHTPSEGC